MLQNIIIERSGDHVHLSKADYEKLFPVNQVQEPHRVKNLTVPGEYVIDEKVTLRTNKGEIPLTVILPTRSYSVVEIGLTQAIKLGLSKLPVQLTSDSLENPDNFVVLKHNGSQVVAHAIIHRPHLHIPEELNVNYPITVEVKGEYFNTSLWNVPVKKVKGLRDCLLHVDNDTYNGIITMNLGHSFSACFDFDLIKGNVPCGSNPVN
jgi:propanediol utilization protein